MRACGTRHRRHTQYAAHTLHCAHFTRHTRRCMYAACTTCGMHKQHTHLQVHACRCVQGMRNFCRNLSAIRSCEHLQKMCLRLGYDWQERVRGPVHGKKAEQMHVHTQAGAYTHILTFIAVRKRMCTHEHTHSHTHTIARARRTTGHVHPFVPAPATCSADPPVCTSGAGLALCALLC